MTAMIISTIVLAVLTAMCCLSTYIIFKQYQRNNKKGKERLEDIIVNDPKIIKKPEVERVDYFFKQTQKIENDIPVFDNNGDPVMINLYTDRYIDFSRFDISSVLVPVDDYGVQDLELIKLFVVDVYTFEKFEWTVKINEYIARKVKNFIDNGNS